MLAVPSLALMRGPCNHCLAVSRQCCPGTGEECNCRGVPHVPDSLPPNVSTRPQLEELSLLLTRLQRHQSKLASVRNFAVGQLLHHYLTFPACQVSTGGPSWAQAGMACLPRFPVPCSGLSCYLSCYLATWLFPRLCASGCCS